ncbi:glucose dehydrogenase [FAD, quinone]-like [Microplitis demolitor]|uniref:glucose dehydrogenase [FAD, quinone]-like n=1 Tax=Microplitis demolitor TaxID=69319 RepID=UPI0004CD4907|nr:glucose dehydrogenase [FAD, quinone]-like [Microplitis demolitor]
MACPNQFMGGPSITEVCPSTRASTVLFLYIVNNLIDISPAIADPCGRVTADEKPRDVYDFIVIGGGAAGSAVAGRLSEVPSWRVLLLEAGPDEPAGAEIPSNFGVYIGSSLDWKYKTTNETHACLAQKGSCNWPRGRNLGGTTVHHGMAYHRGNAKDYENWVAMGNEGWSWAEVLPFFLKSENNSEINRVGRQYHATGGPMTVERFPWKPAFADAILKAANETGYGTTEDMVGEKIHGFTVAQTMSKNGVRQSTASAFLRPIRNRKNLNIVLNSTATKILTRKQKVIGVEYFMNGKIHKAKVTREVVVSGGAVNSPQLLLLSGIGPKEQLDSLGIPVVLDLPGVGKNLHNHVSYKLDFILANEPNSEGFNLDNVSQYIRNQTGPLSSSGLAQVTAILSSRYTTPDYPDLQIFFSGFQASCRENGNVDLTNYYNKRTVRFTAVNLHAKSRGIISLASKNPLEHPIIWSNDLADPADVDVLIDGIHVLINIANSSTMKSLGLTLASQPIDECKKYKFLSDNYFKCAVHIDTRTENHQSGTCKMGPTSDSFAVVDPYLRVHGIQGLRVADASVMPKVVSGNPQATVTMIGERAADFIKKTYSKCSYL